MAKAKWECEDCGHETIVEDFPVMPSDQGFMGPCEECGGEMEWAGFED